MLRPWNDKPTGWRRAFAEKYPTEASRKWVRGFRTPKRRATTTELLPR